MVKVAGAAVLVTVLGACSSGGGSEKSPTGALVTIPVTVTEYTIELPKATFQVGVPYRLVVTNKGVLPHELIVMPPKGTPALAHDQHHEAIAAIPVEDLPPGATSSVDVKFDQPFSSGKLEFACYVPGHYESGMKLAVMVL